MFLMNCRCCGTDSNYTFEDVKSSEFTRWLNCPICGFFIYLQTDTPDRIKYPVVPAQPQEVLKQGDVVRIDNSDHVWHDEIAIVAATKDKFCRLELNGRLTWVPTHWIKKHEPA